MRNVAKTVLMACLAVGLAACNTTMKVSAIDAKTGQFATSSHVTKSEIEVNEPFKPEYADLLYIKTDMKSERYNDFFLKTLVQFKAYKTVADKPAMEALVISRDLTDKVPSVSDLVGLNRLAKEIGPFLILEPDIQWEGGYNFHATFKLIDATSGKPVLVIKRNAFNWAGLDAPLFYPMLNAIGEWSQGKTITVETEKAKPAARN